MSGLGLVLILGFGCYFVWAVFVKRKTPSNEDELGSGILFIRVVGGVVTWGFLSFIGVFFLVDHSTPKDERIILTFITSVASLFMAYFVTDWFEKSYLKKIDTNKQSNTGES